MNKLPRKWRWMLQILRWTFRFLMKVIKWIWPKK